jgi:hypothetical protein
VIFFILVRAMKWESRVLMISPKSSIRFYEYKFQIL